MTTIDTIPGNGTRRIRLLVLARFSQDVGGQPFDFAVTRVQDAQSATEQRMAVTHVASGCRACWVGFNHLEGAAGDAGQAGRLALGALVAQVGSDRARQVFANAPRPPDDI